MAEIYLKSPPPLWHQQPERPAPYGERHFVTFYAGKAFERSANRLVRQAVQTRWFSSIHAFHPDSGHPFMSAFAQAHAGFVQRNPRGYGYWRWKPFLVDRMLNSLPDGDRLYYADAGCEISVLGAARFLALDNCLQERGILCFEIDCPEHEWCKREAVDSVVGSWREDIMNSRQYQATWLGFSNTQLVREALAEWVHWCSRDELITDELNVTAQHPKFREHRHDQALLSLVLKRRSYVALPQEDCFDRALYVIDSWVLLAPVHALRSKRKRGYLDILVKRSSAERCRRNLAIPSSAFLLRVKARQIRLSLRGFAATIAWRLRPSARRGHRA